MLSSESSVNNDSLVGIQEAIEKLVDSKPSAKNRGYYREYKSLVVKLMKRYNELVGFNAYNINRVP